MKNTNDLTHGQFSLSQRVALPLLIFTMACQSIAAQDDFPGYAKTPIVLEYDVDASWPKRPENVQPFRAVSGISVDQENQVWVFNRGIDPIQVYTTEGDFVRTWGRGYFKFPHHLRIDPEGKVWVTDLELHTVQKFTPEGKLLQTLGTPGEKGQDNSHFNKPTDVAITLSGDIFVSDGYGNRRIVHFDKEGNFIKTWGTYGTKPGQFVLPHAIVLGPQGRLYVADRNCGRIQVFDQEGNFLDQWDQVVMPWGLYVNENKDLWVCGSSPHWWIRDGHYPMVKDQLFMRFSLDGRIRQIWTVPMGEKGKTQPGQCNGAHCIAQDSDGNLFVGDIYGEKAQKFVPVTKRPETKTRQ